jgi:protoporphyrinogen oxidase
LATSGFEGENFATCHSVRSGKKYHRQKAVRICDLVIIGAGISGLTAAHKTKSKLDVEVIEKEPRPGGASKRNYWKGVYYSLGAADTGPTYEAEIEGNKTNFLEDLFRELHIQWRKVPDPEFAMKYGKQVIVDPLNSQSEKDEVVNDFKKSFEDAQNRLENIFEEYGRPIIPLEASPNKTMELDKKTLEEIFEGISNPFRNYLQTFSNATFGAQASEISALKGIYYLSRELGIRYACPGGNACVAEKLVQELEHRIYLNSTVVSVEQNAESCFVTYVDDYDVAKTVECKAVIWASEKHYAPYIIKGLPKDQENAFKKVRYSSFIVANILVDKAFYTDAFATYFDDAFFADMVIADWVAKDGKPETNSPAVYTLYCPIGSKQRYKILAEPTSTWKDKIIESLEHHFGKLQDRIVDIQLYRYGHHYVVAYPGFITTERKTMKKPFGNVFFAKDDVQGIPCLESAIWSGADAAQEILQRLE